MADHVAGRHNNYPGQAELTALTDETIAAIGAASSGGGAVTIANGADVAEGSTTDPAVTTDANGTLSAKLRGLIVLMVNFLSRFPESLGAKSTANSLAVTLPTDQAALASTIADGADVALGARADAAIDTDIAGSVSGKLRGLVKLMVNLLSRWPASLTAGGNLKTALLESIPAGTNNIGSVGGTLATASATFARPADTTAYAAKDAINSSTSAPALLSFAAMARVAAGSGYITKARMLTDQTTFVGRLRLHLYHTAPAAINDNAPFTLLYANAGNRVGYIDFDVASAEGTGSTAAGSINSIVRLPFIGASGSQTLYGLLETLDAFTPASGQNFYIELTADQN